MVFQRLFLTASIIFGGSGCLTNSQCQEDFDCSANEICNKSTGRCQVACTKREDCFVNGTDLGKECLFSRCNFPLDKRVAAPNFCLQVINPSSTVVGKEVCLNDLKGKVALLYFAWLTCPHCGQQLVVLQNKMLNVLRSEGLTQIEFWSIVTHANSWDERAEGFDQVTFPIMLDTAGVFYIYSAESFDVILIDKKGRLVTKEEFSPTSTDRLNQRIRQLNSE